MNIRRPREKVGLISAFEKLIYIFFLTVFFANVFSIVEARFYFHAFAHKHACATLMVKTLFPIGILIFIRMLPFYRKKFAF